MLIIFNLIFALVCNNLNAQILDTLFTEENSPISYNTVNTVTTDETGNVWIGTEYGLNRFDGQNWINWFTSDSNLKDDAIRALATDRFNNIWIGGFMNEFSVYDQDSFKIADKPMELDDFIKDILFVDHKEKGDLMILATISGLGIFTINTATWETFDFSTYYLISPNITSLEYIEDKGIFAGTINGGLVNIKEDGNINVIFGEEMGLPDNSILDVAADSTGLLWLASPEGGLFSLDLTDLTFQTFTPLNSAMPSKSINSIAIANGIEVWCGTADTGIVKLSVNGVETFNTGNSLLLNNKVNHLHNQNDSIIWAATDKGLARIYIFDKFSEINNYSNFNRHNFVYPNPTNGLLKINEHYLSNLVVYNNNGQLVFSKKNVEANLNLNHLPNGSYLICAKIKNNNFTQKIVLLK